MTQFNRFQDIASSELADQAEFLLNNPVFLLAVEEVLNDYAAMEEKVLTDNEKEVREITARIKHHAMMRRGLLDAVRKLNTILRRVESESEMLQTKHTKHRRTT